MKTLGQIRNRKIAMLKDPSHPVRAQLAFMLSTLMYHAKDIPEHPPISEVQRMLTMVGSTLYGCLFPDQAADQQPVSVLSGFPMNPRRDDEHWILHFF